MASGQAGSVARPTRVALFHREACRAAERGPRLFGEEPPKKHERGNLRGRRRRFRKLPIKPLAAPTNGAGGLAAPAARGGIRASRWPEDPPSGPVARSFPIGPMTSISDSAMRELEAQFPVFACVIRLDGRHSGSATGKEDEHRRDRHAELIEASRQVIQRLHGLIHKRLLQAIRASQRK